MARLGRGAWRDTLSAYGSGLNFDDRDGQVLLGWVTIDSPSGLPASAYTLKSLSVEISTTNDDIVFDPTLDDRDTHEVDGPADSDLGRPVCLSGVGFRGGFDPETYGEKGPQPFGAVRGQRNAYALAFLEDGTPIDISNNLTDQFDPMFFAVATSADALPGELIPELGSIRFEINLDDPHISCYLKESLSFGTLDLMVTSLHPASQPGSGGEANYPNWIMKDNPLVELGEASAASMEIEVEIIEPSESLETPMGMRRWMWMTCSMSSGAFGPCPCCRTTLTAMELSVLTRFWTSSLAVDWLRTARHSTASTRHANVNWSWWTGEYRCFWIKDSGFNVSCDLFAIRWIAY